jgi:hypothetical protein
MWALTLWPPELQTHVWTTTPQCLFHEKERETDNDLNLRHQAGLICLWSASPTCILINLSKIK